MEHSKQGSPLDGPANWFGTAASKQQQRIEKERSERAYAEIVRKSREFAQTMRDRERGL